MQCLHLYLGPFMINNKRSGKVTIKGGAMVFFIFYLCCHVEFLALEFFLDYP